MARTVAATSDFIKPNRRLLLKQLGGALAGSLTPLAASLSSARGLRQGNLSELGFPSESPDQNARLIEKAINQFDVVNLPEGQFRIGSSVRILRSGVEFVGKGQGRTILISTTNRSPIFLLGGQGVEASDISFKSLSLQFSGIRTPIPLEPSGREAIVHDDNIGMPIRTWQSGIVQLLGGNVRAENLSFRNFDVALLLRGNRWNNDVLTSGFSLKNIEVEASEFGILCQQFRGASIEGLKGSNTSMTHAAPPHLIYVTDRGAKRSEGLALTNITDSDNHFSSSLKLRNVSCVTARNIMSVGCSRGIDFGLAAKVTVDGLRYEGGAFEDSHVRGCFDVNDSDDITISNFDVKLGSNQSFVRVQDDGSPAISHNLTVDHGTIDCGHWNRVAPTLTLNEGDGVLLDNIKILIRTGSIPGVIAKVDQKFSGLHFNKTSIAFDNCGDRSARYRILREASQIGITVQQC